jgi:hypothetical protein
MESQWYSLLMTFFKGFSSHDIALETGLERKRVMRALLVVSEPWPRILLLYLVERLRLMRRTWGDNGKTNGDLRRSVLQKEAGELRRHLYLGFCVARERCGQRSSLMWKQRLLFLL